MLGSKFEKITPLSTRDFSWSRGGFRIHLKRRWLRYLFIYFLPSSLFVLASWTSFLIDTNNIAARCGVLSIVFLSLTTLLVSSIQSHGGLHYCPHYLDPQRVCFLNSCDRSILPHAHEGEVLRGQHVDSEEAGQEVIAVSYDHLCYSISYLWDSHLCEISFIMSIVIFIVIQNACFLEFYCIIVNKNFII